MRLRSRHLASTPDHGRHFRTFLIIAVFALFCLIMVFCRSIEENLEVDENVFITSAELLTRGILPYRDYHYNHMPTLVLIYAGLFQLTDYLLLIARSFSAICGAAAVTVIFAVALKSFSDLNYKKRVIFSIAFGTLYLFNPLFIYTTGLAWNHDFSLLCCLLGFLTLSRGLEVNRSYVWIFLAGFLVALAATTRVTFATTLAPFTLYFFLQPSIDRVRRIRLLLIFAAGFIVASIPSIWIWMQSPENAWFGNFVYPGLNTRYHFENDVGRKRSFTIAARLLYILKLFFTLPGNGIVCIGFIILMCATLKLKRIIHDARICRLFIIFLTVISLISAGFAASPLYRQYLYAATPFMILGILYCIAMRPDLGNRILLQRTGIACVSITVLFGMWEFHGIRLLGSFQSWSPVKIHNAGLEIARYSPDGKILTLEPIYALEGGEPIYPDVATGRFGVRAGQYLTQEQQSQYRMSDIDDLAAHFQSDPPASVLITEVDRENESRLNECARQFGYYAIAIPNSGVLWTRQRPAETQRP